MIFIEYGRRQIGAGSTSVFAVSEFLPLSFHDI